MDLGCGDGILTERLARSVPRGKVLGIDASLHMIETAKMIHRNNLTFIHMDINKMNFEKEFNLIFSNAALHWVKDHRRLLKNAHKALKANGKILWDFGGIGNCANFISVIQRIMAERPYAEYFKEYEWPWFMPSKKQYTKFLSAVGFSSCTIMELNRDRYFPSASDIIRWIDQPCLVPFLNQVPQQLKAVFRHRVIEEIFKKTQMPDGTYFETFCRIRIYAEK